MSALSRVTVDPTLVDEGCVCRFVFDTDDMINDLPEGSFRGRCSRLIVVALEALTARDYRTALDGATAVRALLTLHRLHCD
jgi:hypothetical protein